MKKKTLMITAAVMMLTVLAAKAQDTTSSTTTTTTTSAGDHIWDNPQGWWKYEKNPEDQPLFTHNELSVDLFGTYLNPERRIKSIFNTNIRRGTWGGGVGANYFWSKDVGFGVDTSFQDRGSDFVDHVGGNLIVRLPLNVIRLAPSVFAGGGFAFSPRDTWFTDIGTGLDFRISRHLGLFADGRYIWKDKTSADGNREQLLLRTGFRVIF
jgi:hypothetical protein